MSKNKKNNQIKTKQEETKDLKTIPVVEKECCCSKETACCKSEGCCCSECKCGPDCKCGSKSSCKTAAKCLTMLVSALMISTSILFTGMEMTKPLPAQRPTGNIDLQITDYMRRNPAVVAQVVQDHQEKIKAEREAEEARVRAETERKQAEKLTAYTKDITNDASFYSLGNKDGKFVLIEFFDYRCGWCKKTNKEIWNVIESGKAPNIRWIPVDAPIFGEGSELISRYVLAAGKQGKYTEMHHEVVTASGNLDKTALIELGKKVGLNVEQLEKDASSEEIKTKLENNKKMAVEIGVQGVPFMIVNGKAHGGALIGESLERAVKESNEMK